MLPFFRKIRWRLAANNQFFKYSRYAIGEIVLVVIGILIALQINNWNEERKDKVMTNRLLENVQKELLANIKETDEATAFYRGTDSLIYKILHKKVTYEDYTSNPKLSSVLWNRWRADISEDAFKILMDFEGKVPKELDSIFIKLKEMYRNNWGSIQENNKQVDEMANSNWKEIANTKKWFADLVTYNEVSEALIAYQLNDTIYRNRVAYYSDISGNHFWRIRLYRNKALGIYEEISDYLHLKKDTTVVKNMNDYEHYLGRYEGDSLFNVQIIRKNNTLVFNVFDKNDSIIGRSFRLYPDSKTYSIIGDYFIKSFFNEDNKVSKFAISRGGYREEYKKIK